MTEFMCKHPIITLLIANELFTTIRSFADRRAHNSVLNDTVEEISKAVNKDDEGTTKAREIGFMRS